MGKRDGHSRRAVLGTLGSGAVAATMLAPVRVEAQVGDADAPDLLSEMVSGLGRSHNLKPRQQRSLRIRTQAALDGVRGTIDPRPVPSGMDAALRTAHFAKGLIRDQSKSQPDPSLPDATAFAHYRKALDGAYLNALGASGGGEAADFAAIEALENYIGAPPDPAEKDKKFKFTNPLGGLGYELEGLDPPFTNLGPPYPFDSVQEFRTADTAAQMAEVYWLAKLRDVSLSALDAEKDPGTTDKDVREAWSDLNAFSWYKRTVGPIPWNRLFRVDLRTARNRNANDPFGFAGVEIGPYLSQFFLIGTADKATGKDERSGIVNLGSLRLDQRQRTVIKKNYLFRPAPLSTDMEYLALHNGSRTAIGTDIFEADPRFITTVRDGANYVHFDEIYQEYLIAASILLARIPRSGDTIVAQVQSVRPGQDGQTRRVPSEEVAATVSETTGVPADMLNPGNPYRRAEAQVGFATFGITHILTLLAEVSTRAHKAAWYHKWSLRWLRPEEFAARIHWKLTGGASYDIHDDLISSKDGGERKILSVIRDMNKAAGADPSYLLPMAYPEGSPTHPARPSGHSTVAGAATTILKGLFNGFHDLTQTMPPALSALEPDGKGGLQPYTARQVLTIGGELNKLASNVSMFRMMGGVHWRGDSVSGLVLGEQIGVHLLIEQTQALRDATGRITTRFYRETINGRSPFFRIKLFNGQVVDIRDGRVHTVHEDDPGRVDDWTVSEKGMTFEEFVSEMY
jgi:hypothetical protein